MPHQNRNGIHPNPMKVVKNALDISAKGEVSILLLGSRLN